MNKDLVSELERKFDYRNFRSIEMKVCRVDLNEDTSKYADYIRWFDSLDYEDQKREFLDIGRKSRIDFSAYLLGKRKRQFGDALEKSAMLRKYIDNNNLRDMF